MKRTTTALTVTRFDIAGLDIGKMIAAAHRQAGYRTRIVYRGPRTRYTCYWAGPKFRDYTLKKDAVAFDLYVYKK